MKKKLIMFISGLILIVGVGSYFTRSNTQIAAEEKSQQSSNMQRKSTSVPVQASGPSLFDIDSVLNNKYYTKIGPDDTLPAEYTFIAKPNINTRYYQVDQSTRKIIAEYKYNPSQGNTNNIRVEGGKQAAYFSNVGEYQGKVVDMMVSVKNGIGNVGYNMGDEKSDKNFGSLANYGNSTDEGELTYSYYDNETKEPLVVKGVFSMFIGGGYPTFKWNHRQADATYVNKQSQIRFNTRYENGTTSLLEGNGNPEKPLSEQSNYIVTSVFSGSSFKVGVIKYILAMGSRYVTMPISRMKIPAPVVHGLDEQDGSKHETSFSVTLNQDIPMRLSTFSKYKNLDYTLPTYDLYKVTSFKAINYMTGSDVSSNFTLSDNKLEVNPSFLASDGFYGENYQITLNYELDTTKDYFSLYQDGYLVMPYDPVIQTSDLDGIQTSNSTTAKIKWDYQLEITANDLEYSQGEVKRILKELTPDALKEKILTESNAKGKNLDLDTDLPVTINDVKLDSVAGNYPITLSTSDGGITLTKKINVNVKAILPKVSIPEIGTTVVSSKGVPYTINGTMSDEDSENLSLFVTVDDGQPTTILDKQVNEELNQPIDFTYEIPETQLTELGDHTVKIYAKDGEGNQSEIAQFTLDIRGYLAFKELPPATLDFDAAKISSKGSYAKLNKSVDFSVEDYRGSNTSWKLVGSLITELKDSATNTTLTDGIIYRDEDGNETPFTKGATVKLSTGKATSSNVLFPIKWGAGDNGIFIKTPPDVKKGNYKGSIEMSLVDAP